MPPDGTESIDDEVGSAVQHFVWLSETVDPVDVTNKAGHLPHAAQFTQCRFRLGKDVDR